jgi:hypothetical protein
MADLMNPSEIASRRWIEPGRTHLLIVSDFGKFGAASAIAVHPGWFTAGFADVVDLYGAAPGPPVPSSWNVPVLKLANVRGNVPVDGTRAVGPKKRAGVRLP